MTSDGFFYRFSNDEGGRSEVSGKPYTWQLFQPEDVAYLALPPQAMVERIFARTETFQLVIRRTAAFLVVVSRNNGYDGRDPLIVFDDVRGGAVAQFLNVDLELLAHALAEMQRRGLVSAMDDGNLHIDDLPALDALSERQLAA